MKILIYGLNYYPEIVGTGKYTTELAEYFSTQNNEVRVITANPYYPQWKVKKNFFILIVLFLYLKLLVQLYT